MADELAGHAGTSQMNSREREALLNLCQGAERVLEIGTGDGATVAWLAEQCPGALFVSVDTFPMAGDGRTEAIGLPEGVIGRIDKWVENRRPNMSLYVGTAFELSDLGVADSFDLAIVDGEHTRHACHLDLTAASWMTKPTGVLAVHDYRRPHNGVFEAVTAFCNAYHARILSTIGSIALVTREINPILLKRMKELGYV